MKVLFFFLSCSALAAGGLWMRRNWRRRPPRSNLARMRKPFFWDVRLEDSVEGGDIKLTLNHYIRIKIFTELGKEKYATVEIPQVGKRRATDIAGRTIKPNGNIVELKKDGIFEGELVKTKG